MKRALFLFCVLTALVFSATSAFAEGCICSGGRGYYCWPCGTCEPNSSCDYMCNTSTPTETTTKPDDSPVTPTTGGGSIDTPFLRDKYEVIVPPEPPDIPEGPVKPVVVPPAKDDCKEARARLRAAQAAFNQALKALMDAQADQKQLNNDLSKNSQQMTGWLRVLEGKNSSKEAKDIAASKLSDLQDKDIALRRAIKHMKQQAQAAGAKVNAAKAKVNAALAMVKRKCPPPHGAALPGGGQGNKPGNQPGNKPGGGKKDKKGDKKDDKKGDDKGGDSGKTSGKGDKKDKEKPGGKVVTHNLDVDVDLGWLTGSLRDINAQDVWQALVAKMAGVDGGTAGTDENLRAVIANGTFDRGTAAVTGVGLAVITNTLSVGINSMKALNPKGADIAKVLLDGIRNKQATSGVITASGAAYTAKLGPDFIYAKSWKNGNVVCSQVTVYNSTTGKYTTTVSSQVTKESYRAGSYLFTQDTGGNNQPKYTVVNGQVNSK